MLVTPAGISMEVKLDASRNAYDPILSRLSGRVMEVKPEPENAYDPILVSSEFSSNVTVFNSVVDRNAYEPMLVTLAGMIMEVKLDA